MDVETVRSVQAGHRARLTRLFGGGEGGEPPFYLSGINGGCGADPIAAPEAWVDGAVADCLSQRGASGDRRVFRPLCVEYNPFGVHFVDRILGARVWTQGDQWWSEPFHGPVGELAAPDLANSATWALHVRAAERFLEVDPPDLFFCLPTIASALNVGINVQGEALLAALVHAPEAAAGDLATINSLLVQLHRWYRERFAPDRMQPIVGCQRFQPPGFGQICGCSTQLVSARTYRELIAPLDAALLGAYPGGGMIHLCGAHTHHLPVWRGMGELRAVQVNDRAAEDLPAYVDGLRRDQVIYLNPCEGMPAERALALARGRPMVIVGEPPSGD